ncbi:MAG: glycosyltransferase family 1 protein [Candidatus Sumerlaeia bacterium]|nr:glycosyltransferase family 1 protein [Candidatus Sumerlaeia bacterium]
MKLLHDCRYLDAAFSGIGTYSRGVLEALAALDEKNEHVALVGPRFDGDLRVGPNFSLRSSPAPPVSFRTLTTLGALIERARPTLVHSHFPLAPLRMQPPFIVTLHDLQPFTDPHFSGERTAPVRFAYNQFYRTVYPAVLNRAKWVVCVSYATRDAAAAMLPSIKQKLVVVHSGVDGSIFQQPGGEQIAAARVAYKLDRPYALYFGSTRPNKNLEAMVKAFGLMLQRGDPAVQDHQFVLVLKQDRFFSNVERAIRIRGLADRVRVLHQVSEDEKRVLLAGADALFFATKFEGFGFPALEAMAQGVPVLAGRSGALPEICGEAAHFADPWDEEELAEAMHRVLADEELRGQLIDRGRLHAPRFTWRHTAEFLADVYQLLV